MNFEESVKYLYSLGNEVLAMKLGLENIGKLLAALDNPQNNYLKVQIAGTNGKGSTVAFLEAICLEAGIKTGATTSPHLISVTERVRIDGAEIAEEDFARYASKVREAAENLVKSGALENVPTYFEQVTALALHAFSEAEIELAILETGLGGRFDATTAARAETVAITPIDYDHQRILGETLTEIAAEKAAIIRADTKVIPAPQKTEAERVILGRCREKGVAPIRAAAEVQVKKHSEKGIYPFLTATFETAGDIYPNVEIGLRGMRGRHQVSNASIAIPIAETLREFGFNISKDDITRGLEIAKHRGRLEFWGDYLFDGAHNAGGAKVLREFLDEFVERPITMIFAAMRDKDITEIAATLFPKAAQLILTEVDNLRAEEARKLLEYVPEDFPDDCLFVTETVGSALDLARQISPAENLICVTGSLYLVGEAQKILGENFR